MCRIWMNLIAFAWNFGDKIIQSDIRICTTFWMNMEDIKYKNNVKIEIMLNQTEGSDVF